MLPSPPSLLRLADGSFYSSFAPLSTPARSFSTLRTTPTTVRRVPKISRRELAADLDVDACSVLNEPSPAVLTVAQTLEFALKMKTPSIRPDGQSRKEFEAEYLETLLKTFGIEHARDTVVGNENVRGVSGGERKRVSIAEVLVNRASVVSWDNSSRGLDASTALEYTRSIRTVTDVLGSTTFVSLCESSTRGPEARRDLN